MLAWDDPDVDWSLAPLTVLRSTWNYPQYREAVLDWAMKVAADLEKFASAPGAWAYGKRAGETWPDASNTQYAVLGLRGVRGHR